MKPKAIKLPDWVYGNLLNYHNVALPNACMKMDIKELTKHLEKSVGFKIKIRLAEPSKTHLKYNFRRDNDIKPYLIAEEYKK